MTEILKYEKRRREVLPLLREAIGTGLHDPDVYALLGSELLRVRNYDEAILYCSYALESDPSHPTALRDRMTAIKRRGSIDTKLLRMFGSRPRLADDGKTRISQEIDAAEDE